MDRLLSEEVVKASDVLRDYVKHTPLIHSQSLSNKCGNKVFLKSENLQHTGAFKVRGAMYKMLSLGEDARTHGVVCASAGNHAQGVAYASRLLGVSATIVMPERTPSNKILATKNLGADVIIHGETFDDANRKAQQLRDSHSLIEVHPFDDFHVMAGQGTIGTELLEQLDSVDVILVPIGGGGLIAGVLAAVKKSKPDVQVIGVEPIGACAMFRSFKEGNMVELTQVLTRAEGAAVKRPGLKAFDVVRRLCDDIVVVSEESIEEAVWTLMRDEKLVVEYAGALTVAALKMLPSRNKNVICLVTGGNIDGSLISETIRVCSDRFAVAGAVGV
ncbi:MULTISPECIES: threonine/serine dehydratase [unclassified Fusibacter]|uniref:threonine ammonia-lyase n=1 Tax=unclassified Fusibacter TaxID=2624464 RepID=UPI001011FD07|nr:MULTISPECIES: threonine/serine dehydratase [unclassified Fusibacter]MCK8059575.1 pyridoxal-phosphate dependent enzyme [Fusibacter sp. A2]NPE21376.1 pyridoxal-phosphate dependent enzyme [Fusibacter sp. A1]RXV61792.1 pyridoxal-phosphate dependent enzyme [Fusibacter sp. A1]